MSATEFYLSVEERKNLWGLFSVPKGVTKIGKEAFAGCRDFLEVFIPDSVTKIGDGAFKECLSLQNMYLPDTITEIGAEAFANCMNITKVNIPDAVTEIKNYAFVNCWGLADVHISDSATKIGKSAFFGCRRLTEIRIPDSVTEIGMYAFKYCSGLKELHIPNSVMEIGFGAFEKCTDLTEVYIPDSVKKIEKYAFKDCANLKHIIVSDNFDKALLKNAGVLSECKILTETEAFLQKLSPEDRTILKNLFDDDTRSALRKDGNVPLLEIQYRCRTIFDRKPIPCVPINCDLAVKDVSGKLELYLIPKGETMPIGPLSKYVNSNGKVLTQAINTDLMKASQKTQEQNKNIAEDIIKHKK